MRDERNRSIYEEIEVWAKTANSTANNVIQQASNIFVDVNLKDRRLRQFWVGSNLDAMQKHQSIFLRRVFCNEEQGGRIDKHLHSLYAKSLRYKGVKSVHFDYYCENFISAIQGAGVISRLVERIAERLAFMRDVFAKATMKYSVDREERLFFALDNNGDGGIPEVHIRHAIEVTGLQEENARLYSFFKELDANRGKLLNFKTFGRIIRSSEMLVERALQGSLVIPDFTKFSAYIDEIFDDVRGNRNGKVATYIPPLAEIDPERFGVAIVTVDGQIYVRGEQGMDFSIQSICKPFNYCFALEELGEKQVHEHVGKEPSGRSFNNRNLMIRYMGNPSGSEIEKIEIPYNPMINAGAIMTASLIKSGDAFAVRFSHVRHQWARMIGHVAAENEILAQEKLPRFNKKMARQENFTGNNNMALGYMLMATGKLPQTLNSLPDDADRNDPNDFEFIHQPAVADALKMYFGTCSLELTVKEMATAAATLANGGVCPLTQERVLKQATVRSCLSVMQMCGMYDGSGDFFHNIGIPAKSGVGGGVMLVIPKLMGICVFSPRLDPQGNSVRGVEFARQLVQKCRLHAYDSVMSDGERLDPRLPLARFQAAQVCEALWAASKGDVRTLVRLYEEQYDLGRGDCDWRTPMHLAAAEGHANVIEFLLKCGIAPKLDRWGAYPIDDAIEGKHSHIVGIFEQQNMTAAKPHRLVEDMNGPQDAAADYIDDLAVVELLWAAAQNDVTGLCRLVAQGVPVHARNYDRRTALHLAAAAGHLKAAKYLIAHGHPLNVRDRWHATPLDEAHREKRKKAMRYLKKQLKRSSRSTIAQR